MRDYCKVCGKEVDETEFAQYGTCPYCNEERKEIAVIEPWTLKESEKFYCPVCRSPATITENYGHKWVLVCVSCNGLKFAIWKKGRSCGL